MKYVFTFFFCSVYINNIFLYFTTLYIIKNSIALNARLHEKILILEVDFDQYFFIYVFNKKSTFT